mmetsp:Transcript_48637/g.54377  ORF Transcript_48637/g.54377 Transcript_48637/m.54377 type:complete len:814 (-) Transcript_48637:1114-3555(-)
MLQFLQLKNLGLSWLLVLILCISTLIIFWAPIRRLINEWRLYRRCQKYPHIVVCKENSKTRWKLHQLRHNMERNTSNQIKNLLLLIATLFGRVCGFFFHTFLTALNVKRNCTSAVETPSTPSYNTREERKEITTEALNNAVKERPPKYTPSLPEHYTLRKEVKMRRPNTTKCYYTIQDQPTDLFELESESSTAEDNVKNRKFYQLPSKQSLISEASTKPLQQPRNVTLGKKLTSRSESSKRKFSSPMSGTVITIVDRKESLYIDSSSLSDQIRKRRLNGETIALQQTGVTSRKKRRLNSGRISALQGCCVARRPSGILWQSRKPLDKREREEREERLLRGMNHKRTKGNDNTTEKTKSAIGTESTTASAFSTNHVTAAAPTPAASVSTFNFGETSANTSNKQGSKSTDAPTSASVIDRVTIAAPTPAVSAPTFNFGQTSANTLKEKQTAPELSAVPSQYSGSGNNNAVSTSDKTVSSLVSNPNPEPQKSETTRNNTATNSQSATQAHSLLGNASTTANTVVGSTTKQQSFSFGSTSAPQNQSSSTSVPTLAPDFSTASRQVQFGSNGQGSNVAAVSQQSTTAQGNLFGGLVPTPVSTSNGNQPFSLSTPAPAPTLVSTQDQFGGAGQFNNAAPPSSHQSASTQGNLHGASNGYQPFSQSTSASTSTPVFGGAEQFNNAVPPSSEQSNTQGFNQNLSGNQEFGQNSTFVNPVYPPQNTFGNTKENTNPGTFNSTYQQPLTGFNGTMLPASNGFTKPDPTNGNNAPFGAKNTTVPNTAINFSDGGPMPSFGFGTGVPSSGASARRQARKSRVRQR